MILIVMMRIACYILIFLMLCPNAWAKEEAEEKQEEAKKAVYYELVHENLRPDHDEFYVGSIYRVKGVPRVTLRRSKNKRSGPLYINYSEYGVGDTIAKNLVIRAINTKLREVLVYNPEKKFYYGLGLSHGNATSRLVLKPDFKFPKKKKKAEQG